MSMLDDIELQGLMKISITERRLRGEQLSRDLDAAGLPGLAAGRPRFTLVGIVKDPVAHEFLTRLSTMFDKGVPVTFVANIEADTRARRVLLENLYIRGAVGVRKRSVYTLSLAEVAGPLHADSGTAVEGEILRQATHRVQQLAAELYRGLGLMEQLSAWIPRLGALDRALQKQMGQ
jgi:hypothetical protein